VDYVPLVRIVLLGCGQPRGHPSFLLLIFSQVERQITNINFSFLYRRKLGDSRSLTDCVPAHHRIYYTCQRLACRSTAPRCLFLVAHEEDAVAFPAGTMLTSDLRRGVDQVI